MGTNSAVKRKFLAVYDYGMGGTWSVITAHNAKEITEKFPQLSVYDYEQLPEWATPEWVAELEAEGIYDIDAPPTRYFELLLEEKQFGPRGKREK